MVSSTSESSKTLVARYFDMWNSGDTSIAAEILSADWVDHAHPEVTGPESVREAVQSIRAARPGLRFQIDAILGEGDLVAVVGTANRGPADDSPSRLIWLVHVKDGRMTEMRTYREN
jgi:ketosteroid isomerase-like protein